MMLGGAISPKLSAAQIALGAGQSRYEQTFAKLQADGMPAGEARQRALLAAALDAAANLGLLKAGGVQGVIEGRGAALPTMERVAGAAGEQAAIGAGMTLASGLSAAVVDPNADPAELAAAIEGNPGAAMLMAALGGLTAATHGSPPAPAQRPAMEIRSRGTLVSGRVPELRTAGPARAEDMLAEPSGTAGRMPAPQPENSGRMPEPQTTGGPPVPQVEPQGPAVRVVWADERGMQHEGDLVARAGGMAAIYTDDGSLHQVRIDRVARASSPMLPGEPTSPGQPRPQPAPVAPAEPTPAGVAAETAAQRPAQAAPAEGGLVSRPEGESGPAVPAEEIRGRMPQPLYTRQQLEGMKAPELRVIAKPLGVSPNAARFKLVEGILAAQAEPALTEAPTVVDALARQREDLVDQIRHEVAIGDFDNLTRYRSQVNPNQSLRQKGFQKSATVGNRVRQGSMEPKALVSAEEALALAEGMPEDSKAKLLLNNLRELEKNPRGTPVVKVNTNDLPDGARVVMNEGETLTVDLEERMVRNNFTAPIPEEGVDLYGRRVLPPKAPGEETKAPLVSEEISGRMPEPQAETTGGPPVPRAEGGEVARPEVLERMAREGDEAYRRLMGELPAEVSDVRAETAGGRASVVPGGPAAAAGGTEATGAGGAGATPERSLRAAARAAAAEPIRKRGMSLRETPEGELVAERADGSRVVLRVEEGPAISDREFIQSLAAQAPEGARFTAADGEHAVPRTMAEYEALSEVAKSALRASFPTGGCYDRRSRAIILSPHEAANPAMWEHELQHAEFARLSRIEQRAIVREFGSEEAALAAQISEPKTVAQRAVVKLRGELGERRGSVSSDRLHNHPARAKGLDRAFDVEVRDFLRSLHDAASDPRLMQGGTTADAEAVQRWANQATQYYEGGDFARAIEASEKALHYIHERSALQQGPQYLRDQWEERRGEKRAAVVGKVDWSELPSQGGPRERRTFDGAAIVPEEPRGKGLPPKAAYHDLVRVGIGFMAKGVRKRADLEAKLLPITGPLSENQRRNLWDDVRYQFAAGVTTGRWNSGAVEGEQLKRQMQGGTESARRTIERVTGIADQRANDDLAALGAKLRTAEKTSGAGYKAGFEEAAQTLVGLRKELARIVQENLPAEEQGKMLQRVADVRGLSQFKQALARAQDLLADADVRAALKELETLTGKLPTMRVAIRKRQGETILDQPWEEPPAANVNGLSTEAVHESWQDVELRRVNLNKLPLEAREEVGKLISQAQSVKLAMDHIVEKGATFAAKQTEIGRYRELSQQVRQIVADARNAEQVRVLGKLERREDLVKGVLDHVGRAPVPELGSSEKAPRASLAVRVGREGMAPFHAIADEVLGRDSEGHKLVIAQVRRAQDGMYGERRDFMAALAGPLQEAGIALGSKALDRWMNRREEFGVFGGRRLKMTRDEALGIVAIASDPQTANLIDGLTPSGEAATKWTFASRRTGEHILTLEDVQLIRESLSHEELGLLEAFKKYNQEVLTQRAFATKLELSGTAPTPHIGYFPRARAMAKAIAALPAGWRAWRARMMENLSSMQERAPDTQKPWLVKGFMASVTDYVNDAAKLIHMAEPVRMAAGVLEDPHVIRAIEHRYGADMNRRIERFLEDTMMVERPAEGITIAQTLMRNVARAWLQLNPWPVTKQVIGGTMQLGFEFDAADWGAGLKGAMSPQVYREMTENSGIAWNRYEGTGIYGQYTPMSGERPMAVEGMDFWEAIKAGRPMRAIDALPFMQWADGVPLRAAWEASKSFVERTQPELKGAERMDAVRDKFLDAVMRTQNGSTSTELSGYASMARGSAMLQALLMFKSDSNKKWGQIWSAYQGGEPGRMLKVAVGLAAGAAAMGGVAVLRRQGVDAAAAAIAGADSDPERQKDKLATAGWEFLRNMTPFYGGDELMALVKSVATDKQPTLASPPLQAAADLMDRSWRLYQAAHKAADAEGEVASETGRARAMKAAEPFLKALATAGGIPVAPAYNLVKQIVNAASYEKPDARLAANKEERATARGVRSKAAVEVAGLDRVLARRRQLSALGERANRSERAELVALERAAGAGERYLDAVTRGRRRRRRRRPSARRKRRSSGWRTGRRGPRRRRPWRGRTRAGGRRRRGGRSRTACRAWRGCWRRCTGWPRWGRSGSKRSRRIGWGG